MGQLGAILRHIGAILGHVGAISRPSGDDDDDDDCDGDGDGDDNECDDYLVPFWGNLVRY